MKPKRQNIQIQQKLRLSGNAMVPACNLQKEEFLCIGYGDTCGEPKGDAALSREGDLVRTGDGIGQLVPMFFMSPDLVVAAAAAAAAICIISRT